MPTLFVDSVTVTKGEISSSLLVTSNIDVTGTLHIGTGVTGSALGTASFTLNAVSASYVTSSNVYGLITSASYSFTSSFSTLTSSYFTETGATMELATSYVSGSNILFSNFTLGMFSSTAVTSLASGSLYLCSIYIPTAATITGIRTYVGNSAVFVTSSTNYSGMALYSYNAGTLTLIASSSRDTNLWRLGTRTGSFASPITLNPGPYYVGFLYNRTSQTTAPGLASAVAATNIALNTIDFTNNAALFYNTTTLYSSSLPTSIATSACTALTTRIYAALY